MCFWIAKFHTIFIRKFSFSVSIFEIYLWTKMMKFFLAKCFVSSFQRCRFNVRKATILLHRLSYSHIPPLCLPPFPLYELDLRYIIIRTDIVWQVLSLSLSLDVSLFTSSFNRTAMKRRSRAVPCRAVRNEPREKAWLVYNLWKWKTRTKIIPLSEKEREKCIFLGGKPARIRDTQFSTEKLSEHTQKNCLTIEQITEEIGNELRLFVTS